MVNVRKARPMDYVRFVISALILLFSLVVTFYAIVMKKTSFWESVPGWVALVLFLVFLFLLGLVEGLQIALVELKRQHPHSYKHSHPQAYELGQRAASGDNVERFLMGRQVVVVVIVYFSAKLTTITLGMKHSADAQLNAMTGSKIGVMNESLSSNITMFPSTTTVGISQVEDFLFPTPEWFRNVFLETGILACIIVVNIAQLMPQIVAAKFPVHFLQLRVMKPTYWLCIIIEMSGLTHVTWLLSELIMLAFGMKEEDEAANPKDIERAINELDVSFKGDKGLACNESCSSDSDESSGEEDNEDNNSDTGKKSRAHLFKKKSPTTRKLPKSAKLEEHMGAVIKNYAEVMKTQTVTTKDQLVHPIDSHQLRYGLEMLVVTYQKQLHSNPDQFRIFPYVTGSGKSYRSPGELAAEFEQAGCSVPDFLLDIYDSNHIPPHIVACNLCSLVSEKNQEIETLNAKIEKLKNHLMIHPQENPTRD